MRALITARLWLGLNFLFLGEARPCHAVPSVRQPMNRLSLIWAKRAKLQLSSWRTCPISLHWSAPKVSSCPTLVIQLSTRSRVVQRHSEKPVLFALTRVHVQGCMQDFEGPSHPLFLLWTCPFWSSLWGLTLFPVPDYKDWILMRFLSWRAAIWTSQLDESEAIGHPSIPRYIYSTAWLKRDRILSPRGSRKQTTRLSSQL